MLFILLPIGHEHTEVRRWPHVSLTILLLNLAMFGFTYLRGTGQGERAAVAAVNEAVEYALAHPYLKMSEDFQKRLLDKKERKDLAEMLEARRGLAKAPEPQVEATEQLELDRLCGAALRSLSGVWVLRYGFQPSDPKLFTLLTSMFTHAGWLHLIFNMLFFYLAGPFLEDVYGRPIFAALYLTGGAAAALTHLGKFPNDTTPLIGASGAIAALMGAFLVRFLRTRIKFAFVFLPFFFTRRRFPTFWAPAYIMLPLWLLQQVWDASVLGESAGVAFWAHIGGFVFGAVAALALQMGHVEERFVAPRIEAEIALERHPGLTKGIEAREAGKLKQARFYLDQAAKATPADPDVQLELFRTEAALGDAGAAQASALRHLAIEVKANRMDSAWATWEEASARYPEMAPPAAHLLALGRFAERNRNDAAALEIYAKTAAHHPADPAAAKALACAAAIHARGGDARAAVESLRRALHTPKLDADVARDLEARLREIALAAGIAVPALPRVAPKGMAPPVRGPVAPKKAAPAAPAPVAAAQAAGAPPEPAPRPAAPSVVGPSAAAPSTSPPVLGPPVTRKRGA